jgi:hypothetical protein
MLQPIAHVTHVDQTPLVQLVGDDKVPRGARGEEPLAVVRSHDAVARRLVGVVLQHVGVEIGRVVLHRPRHGGFGGQRAVGALQVPGRAEDLVLGAHLLQLALEAFVFGCRLLLCFLERGQGQLELLDVAFLSFSESTLASMPALVQWLGAMPLLPGVCDVRCSVLGLPPKLGGSKLLFLPI